MATCRADNGERVNLFQLVELASGLLAPVEMSYIYVLINSNGDKVEFSIHYSTLEYIRLYNEGNN